MTVRWSRVRNIIVLAFVCIGQMHELRGQEFPTTPVGDGSLAAFERPTDESIRFSVRAAWYVLGAALIGIAMISGGYWLTYATPFTRSRIATHTPKGNGHESSGEGTKTPPKTPHSTRFDEPDENGRWNIS